MFLRTCEPPCWWPEYWMKIQIFIYKMSNTKVDNFPKAVVEFQQRSELLVCVDSKLSGNLSDLITGRFCQRPESFITPNLINVSHCDTFVCHLLQNLLISRKDICQDEGIRIKFILEPLDRNLSADIWHLDQDVVDGFPQLSKKVRLEMSAREQRTLTRTQTVSRVQRRGVNTFWYLEALTVVLASSASSCLLECGA